MNPVLRFIRSFRFAYEGIKYALATQPNMKFHFFVSFVALFSAILLQLSRMDILFILLAITLVIMAELVNTAVEKAVDLAMPDRHPLAKIAKDTAAAAVLVTAVFAAAVGMIVFYEPIDRLLRFTRGSGSTMTAASVWIYLVLVMLTVVVAETRFSRASLIRPSLWMAVAFSLSTLITLLVGETLVALLAYSLSVLFLVKLYQRKNRTLPALLSGAAIGCAITFLAYYLNDLNTVF